MHMSDLGHHQFLIKTKFKPLHGWMKRDGEKTQKEGEEYYYLNSSTLNITPQPSSQTSVTQIPAMAASGHPSTNKRLHCKVENSFPVTSLYKSRKMSTHYCPNKKNEGEYSPHLQKMKPLYPLILASPSCLSVTASYAF